tara:strand:+ start:654 stop:1139 length:486 start_codon:yes stop_codon:yes gene_type:complete
MNAMFLNEEKIILHECHQLCKADMRKIDISHYDIIKMGVEFKTITNTPSKQQKIHAPDVNSLLPHMERNESYVYWLQPKHGQMEQQEACICVNGDFFTLNGKLEKAIFRNVRLTRDFKNFEKLVDGTCKLVIPRRLMQEKLRTSKRVSFSFVCVSCMHSIC